MNKEEAEKVVKDTIEYANKEIEKNKKRYLRNVIIILATFLVLILAFFMVFKYEMPIKYSKDIVEVNIPEDQGLDIQINLSNYKSANALLVKTGEDTYDLYINVTQTIATKMLGDNDKTNNLLRVGNHMIVDFQSEKLRGYIPNGNDAEVIKNIYYIDNLSKKNMNMSDNELINYPNKILIWERE